MKRILSNRIGEYNGRGACIAGWIEMRITERFLYKRCGSDCMKCVQVNYMVLYGLFNNQ